MALRHHTVIFVPHARARFRKWRISNRQLMVGSGLLILLALGSVFTTWSFFTNTVDRAELAQIRDENNELQATNASFESNILALQKQLTEYEERTRRLAIVAGLEAMTSNAEIGIGGETLEFAPRPIGSESDLIDTRTEAMDATLDAVAERLDERLYWISSTPAIAPAKGIITSGFGYRSDPMTRSRQFHGALDIAASPYGPVKSPADGIVIKAGPTGGGMGTAVYISHGLGVTTRYAHLARVKVEAGQRVRRGDVVGTVGNTGRATGYHLHYEVRVDDKPVNPLGYILDGNSNNS